MKQAFQRFRIRSLAVWNLLTSDGYSLISSHGEVVQFNRIMATPESTKLLRYYADEIEREHCKQTVLDLANQILAECKSSNLNPS